jgi:hypothetical protein
MGRFGPSLYFASDKVIFDAINQRAVKIDLIRALLQERGIFVSTKTPKEELAKHFSRLTVDFFDHREIAGTLGATSTKDRFTSFEIDNAITSEGIRDALQDVKKMLAKRGEVLNIDTADPNKIVAEIHYEHIDYAKGELRQVQPKDAVLEFIKDDDGKYTVRHTHTSFVDSIVEEACKKLAESTGAPISRTTINLQGYPQPKARIDFFNNLIKGIPGFEFITVTEAYCYKPPKKKSKDDDSEDEKQEIEDSPHVERVGLRGRGVTRSLVIGDLHKDGYYTVKVLWQVRSKASLDSDVLELEAQFSEMDSCTAFAYQIKRIFMVDEGKLTDKTRYIKPSEEAAMSELIEAAAKSAYQQIAGGYNAA